MKNVVSLPACVAATLGLVALPAAVQSNPKMDVIKGTSEGIVLIGPKRNAPAPATPAAATSTTTGTSSAAAPASGVVGWGAPRAGATTTAATTAAPATGEPLLDRLRGSLNLFAPATGQTMSSVKKQAGSDSVGIPLPTGATPGGK